MLALLCLSRRPLHAAPKGLPRRALSQASQLEVGSSLSKRRCPLLALAAQSQRANKGGGARLSKGATSVGKNVAVTPLRSRGLSQGRSCPAKHVARLAPLTRGCQPHHPQGLSCGACGPLQEEHMGAGCHCDPDMQARVPTSS